MKSEMKCPICGKINEREYFCEEVGLVEDYYGCTRCGQGYEMCYSSPHEYIDLYGGVWDLELLKKAWKGERDD